MEGRAEFARAFKDFMDAMLREAQAGTAPQLVDVLAEHLGADPARLGVYAEEYEPFEQPNLQVALDAHLARPGVTHRLVGVALENKRFASLSLSDLLAQGLYRTVRQGPVDFVNFHLARGATLAELAAGGRLAERLLGFRPEADPSPRAGMPTGFPPTPWVAHREPN